MLSTLTLPTHTWLLAHHLQLPPHQLCTWHQQRGDIETQVATLACDDIQRAIEQELRWSEQTDHHIIPFTDIRYPPLLHTIKAPPLLLYLKGQPQCLKMPQCCIVGSRKASEKGLDRAYQIAYKLSQQGYCITSGLALGIDGQAHRGALANQGVSIAVLGAGLHHLYPRRHHYLAHKLCQTGCLVSAYPLATPIRRHQFPERNHLMSALALGTLIVEARIKSGSMISAYAAAEQGREVMVIPGRSGDESCSGNRKLIEEGATVIQTLDCINTALQPSRHHMQLLAHKQLIEHLLVLLHRQPQRLVDLRSHMHTTDPALHQALQHLLDHQIIECQSNMYIPIKGS